MHRHFATPLLTALLCVAPLPLLAQASGAYRDAVARDLVTKARASRSELGRSISAYTAVVRQRSAVKLRMPLRDRLLDRDESAARVRWSRDGDEVVQVLGAREQSGVRGVQKGHFHQVADDLFDPAGDRVYFALASFGMDEGDDEFWTAHPLAEGSEEVYSYASGDTMTVRLSGRTIRAVQLNVIPRIPSFHYFTATLWLEPESGALVQAVYRPARTLDVLADTSIVEAEDQEHLWVIPGLFKPMEVDFESIIVQYSLWDLKHWLPRLTRVEGYFRAGAIRVPFSTETGYEIESVIDDSDGHVPAMTPEELVKSWGGVDIADYSDMDATREAHHTRVFAPRDLEALTTSDELPPPIWEDAPAFATDGELEALVEALEKAVPRAAIAAPLELDLQWGGGAPDLLRYNRVEGLSVGVRGTAVHPLGTGRATVRIGTADLTPNVELAASHPRWGRTLGASVYHQLVAVHPASLGLGNSASALLFGRDAGEYYRATGLRFDVAPDASDRAWYRWSFFAERQRPVERGTVWSFAHLVDSERDLRPNLQADPADLLGASLSLAPWWGQDPAAPQGGVEYYLEGAAGDYRFARSSLTARGILPLGARHRFGVEAGGGTAWGDLPAQSNWFLGGSESLRGYDASAAVGPDFVRGRAELARGGTRVGLALFGDAGWAGQRDSFDGDDVLFSAGVGATFMEGLLRFDLARALRDPTGWRLEMYVDAAL